MGTITLIGAFIIIGAIFWTKKSIWQIRNPIAFTFLLGSVVFIGIMLGPHLYDYFVPDFLEKWSYVDSYQDGPGGVSNVLFWVMIIILGFALVIISKLLRVFLKFRYVGPALLIASGLTLFYFGAAIGMNLKAIKVDVAKTTGRQMAPVGQQLMVSGLNTLGTFSNQVSQGLQSKHTIAPKHIIREVQNQRHEEKKSEGDFAAWQPWAGEKNDKDKQTLVPNDYRGVPNDVNVPTRSSALQRQETLADSEREPARSNPKPSVKSKGKKKDRPPLLRFGKKKRVR